MPGEGNSFKLGPKTLRKKLSIEVMKPLMDAAASSRVGASNTEPAPAEVPAMSPEGNYRASCGGHNEGNVTSGRHQSRGCWRNRRVQRRAAG